MKKLIVPVLFLSLALGGCASTGFLGFIATTDYVDKKLADEEEKARLEQERQKVEMERVVADLKEALAAKEQAEAAADQAARAENKADDAVEQVAAAQEEVDALTVVSQETKAALEELGARLASLPEETLKMLIGILQASLPQEASGE